MMDIKRFICGNLEANGYVVSSRDGSCYIIDPGYKPQLYVDFLKEKKLEPLGIILTHHHYDHSGAAEQLRRELGCPVMMHRIDADMYDDEVDVFFEGGESLTLGETEFQIIHTPGHTWGGICIMFPSEKVCFTGDTVFDIDLGRTDLEDGSPEEMVRSISDVVDRWGNDIRIYPGHGGDCTMKSVRRINREFLEITG